MRITAFSPHALERMEENGLSRHTAHGVVAAGKEEDTYSVKGCPRKKFSKGAVVVVVSVIDGTAVTVFKDENFQGGKPHRR